jgi:hypothetical protein
MTTSVASSGIAITQIGDSEGNIMALMSEVRH